MKRVTILFALLLTLLVLAACAPGPNPMADVPNEEGEVAGFWKGLWHGIISPVTFIISLFNESVEVYEVHNNGGWYTFGFMFGFCLLPGGGGSGAACRRRRKRWD